MLPDRITISVSLLDAIARQHGESSLVHPLTPAHSLLTKLVTVEVLLRYFFFLYRLELSRIMVVFRKLSCRSSLLLEV